MGPYSALTLRTKKLIADGHVKYDRIRGRVGYGFNPFTPRKKIVSEFDEIFTTS